MSAQFWTKILMEAKKGHSTDKWRKDAYAHQFNSEKHYAIDIEDAVYTWLNREASRLPPVTNKEKRLITKLTQKLISNGDGNYRGYMNNMYLWGGEQPNLDVTHNSANTWVKFIMMPLVRGKKIRKGKRTNWRDIKTRSKKEMSDLGAAVLNGIIDDPAINPNRMARYSHKATGGKLVMTRGKAFSSKGSLEKAKGVDWTLHGDHHNTTKTTASAYGARQAVREAGGRDKGYKEHAKDVTWEEAKDKLNTKDLIKFLKITDEFEAKLFDYIDEEYGFEVLQHSPVDGSKLEDEYVLVQTSKGTAKSNEIMKQLGADAVKGNNVFDNIVNDGVKAITKDLKKTFKGKKAKEAIEASLPLIERGKRASMAQAMKAFKKTLKKRKGTTFKFENREGKVPKGKNYKKPKAVVSKGKRRGKKKKHQPKRKSLKTNPSNSGTTNRSIAKSKNGRGSSPIALLALINKALPERLEQNMTGVYPKKLEYRTGRFADNAKVTQVIPFPRMTEIRYTYMKDPYQVFEPEFGHPLSSAGRDPKLMIGRTIREIAQEMMGTKYGLVRTKRI